MSNKLIYKYDEVKDKILSAVDKIADPIRQTIGPAGGNCIYETHQGNQFFTNDGVTIAKNIFVRDPVENVIVEIIKGGSLKTNTEAGDGTSSTILLSSILIKEGLRLVDDGYNHMEVKSEFEDFSKRIIAELDKGVTKVKTDEELLNIAKISSNNDLEIAKDVVETIKVVGEDGQIMINPGYTEKTEIIKDTGFIIKSGIPKELAKNESQAAYANIPVFITDKRLYYSQEAETILSTIIENGYRDVVIIAADFIGEALPHFIANHQQGNVNVLLVKETDTDILNDIAAYLNGEVVSDKAGKIVNTIEIGNFTMASSVYADGMKTIISRYKDEKNPGLDKRVEMLKKEMKKIGNKNDPDYIKLQNRVAGLTMGMVTLKVGGRTQLEVIEKIYRYEDAVNATRSAMSGGYLVGGGLGLYNALQGIKTSKKEFQKVFNKVCTANMRQVAENAGVNPDICLHEVNELRNEFKSDTWGFNASNGKYEDLMVAGIIEPHKVITQVINNAVSIANIIITSRYLVVNDIEDYGENKKK